MSSAANNELQLRRKNKDAKNIILVPIGAVGQQPHSTVPTGDRQCKVCTLVM